MAKRKLPEVSKIFNSKEELDAGQAAAITAGHDYDTKKYKVSLGEKTFWVLGFSPANAVSQVWKELGIGVEEVDPKGRAAKAPQTPEAIFGSLSDEDKKVIEKLLREQKKNRQ
jgi:hypothetical protein